MSPQTDKLSLFVCPSLVQSRESSVSNILASHGIALVRGRQIKITYRSGETFELHEFSSVDLNLRNKSAESERKVI